MSPNYSAIWLKQNKLFTKVIEDKLVLVINSQMAPTKDG